MRGAEVSPLIFSPGSGAPLNVQQVALRFADFLPSRHFPGSDPTTSGTRSRRISWSVGRRSPMSRRSSVTRSRGRRSCSTRTGSRVGTSATSIASRQRASRVEPKVPPTLLNETGVPSGAISKSVEVSGTEVSEKIGSPGWARTSDFLINSQALYQLSYRGTSKSYRSFA